MTVATKLDQKKELKVLYSPPAHPTLVAVPPLTYLMIDGATPAGSSGPAEDPGFGNAIGALYAVAYTLKFEGKAAGRDHVVMPLEGLFWNIGKEGFRPGEGGPMRWTLMILQPEWVGPDAVASAAGTLVEEGRLPSAPPIRLETLREGRAAQVLHVGPYSQEPPTIEKLRGFISGMGLRPAGKHHEIYLSDPNRTAPDRLKTVIRQPVR